MKLWVVYLNDYETSYTIGIFSSYARAYSVLTGINIKLEEGDGRINGWLYKGTEVVEMTLDKEAQLQ